MNEVVEDFDKLRNEHDENVRYFVGTIWPKFFFWHRFHDPEWQKDIIQFAKLILKKEDLLRQYYDESGKEISIAKLVGSQLWSDELPDEAQVREEFEHRYECKGHSFDECLKYAEAANEAARRHNKMQLERALASENNEKDCNEA